MYAMPIPKLIWCTKAGRLRDFVEVKNVSGLETDITALQPTHKNYTSIIITRVSQVH